MQRSHTFDFITERKQLGCILACYEKFSIVFIKVWQMFNLIYRSWEDFIIVKQVNTIFCALSGPVNIATEASRLTRHAAVKVRKYMHFL